MKAASTPPSHRHTLGVMRGHSLSKNGVLSHAYDPRIHVFPCLKTWMASESGLPDFRIKYCRKSARPDLR